MSELPVPYATVEEYLSYDRDSEIRNEYYDGEIVAMSGGSPDHALIASNAIRLVSTHLIGKCRVYTSDLKVVILSHAFVYPDLSVVCGKPQYRGEGRDVALLNPSIVVEVLGPSTESRDRREKLFYYLQIDSLKEYLLISQDEPRMELYHRDDEGEWKYKFVAGLDAVMHLPSIDYDLRFADAYQLVEWREASEES